MKEALTPGTVSVVTMSGWPEPTIISLYASGDSASSVAMKRVPM